jgi:hypothetical protein
VVVVAEVRDAPALPKVVVQVLVEEEVAALQLLTYH